jgi:hypothetical protein
MRIVVNNNMGYGRHAGAFRNLDLGSVFGQRLARGGESKKGLVEAFVRLALLGCAAVRS